MWRSTKTFCKLNRDPPSRQGWNTVHYKVRIEIQGRPILPQLTRLSVTQKQINSLYCSDKFIIYVYDFVSQGFRMYDANALHVTNIIYGGITET